jgi:hypothetical protein
MTDMLDQSSPDGFDATRDPATMTPPQRRREIAAILARGVHQLPIGRSGCLLKSSGKGDHASCVPGVCRRSRCRCRRCASRTP